LEALENEEEALREYLAAVAITSDYADAHYNAARLYSRSDDLDRCLQHLERATELEPELQTDAVQNDDLSWVLELHKIRESRQDRLHGQQG
jgi:tetratricopeptide (TPR) repeat protein